VVIFITEAQFTVETATKVVCGKELKNGWGQIKNNMYKINEKQFNEMPQELKALYEQLPNPTRDEVVRLFPESKSSTGKRGGQGFHNSLGRPDKERKDGETISGHNDSGSASRFFYCAKASKKDRNEGLEGFEEKEGDKVILNGICKNCRKVWIDGKRVGDCCDNRERTTEAKATQANNHPTVKPTPLMQYLVRLVTPVGGTVLDPFMGSGSTGKACALEGFDFIGIEKDPEYCKIAEARIEYEVGKP